MTSLLDVYIFCLIRLLWSCLILIHSWSTRNIDTISHKRESTNISTSINCANNNLRSSSYVSTLGASHTSSKLATILAYLVLQSLFSELKLLAIVLAEYFASKSVSKFNNCLLPTSRKYFNLAQGSYMFSLESTTSNLSAILSYSILSLTLRNRSSIFFTCILYKLLLVIFSPLNFVLVCELFIISFL